MGLFGLKWPVGCLLRDQAVGHLLSSARLSLGEVCEIFPLRLNEDSFNLRAYPFTAARREMPQT
jgi:hypothetical protein